MRPETNARWDMADARLISMLFLCISTQLPTVRHTEARTLPKIPGFTRLSWRGFSTRCCNTSKPLIGSEYTKEFRCPHSQKSRGLRSGDRADIWLGLRVLSTVHRKSGSGAAWQCGEHDLVFHHAWSTCVFVDEGHMFQEYWKIIHQKTVVHCTC
jgi:hypothetical protein